MSQLDAVKTLAMLLQDRELRHRFASDRMAVVRELGVAADQIPFVCELDTQQLNDQAESLIDKRRSEVARLLPQTWLRLGAEANQQFLRYSDQAPWPEGFRRHFIDAAMFCQYLQRKTSKAHLRSEQHRVAFLASDQAFSVRVLPDLIFRGRKRWAVQLCTRRKGAVTSKAYHFVGFPKRNRS